MSDCFCPDNHVIVSFLFLQIWIGFRDFRFHRFQSAFALHTQVSGGSKKSDKLYILPSYFVCFCKVGNNALSSFIFSLLFSPTVVSDSLQRLGLQHTRLPFPSPSPRACSNSCPVSQWCHPTILSSVIPFFSWLLSFSAAGSFPVSQLFTSGGQIIEL